MSHPVKPGQHPGLELHTSCPSTNTKTATYRLCVAVRRLGYPQEAMAIGPGSKAWVQPAHSITFLPPVTLLNLLPCQLEYKVQDTELRGAVRPGAETPLLIEISTIYELDFSLEAFPGLGSLIMQPTSGAFEARIRLSDATSQPVYLKVKVAIQSSLLCNPFSSPTSLFTSSTPLSQVT